MTELSSELNSAGLVRLDRSKGADMQHQRVWGGAVLYAGLLLSCTLHLDTVVAKSPVDRPIVFALCSDNLQNILVTKQADGGSAYR